MSDKCERFEVLTSTFLDDGLDRAEQRELLDHLTRCTGCRRFYRDARALDGLVAIADTGAAPDGETAPAEIWQRIERRTRDAARPSSRRSLVWTLAAAAALAVGIALPFIPWPGAAPPAGGQTVDVLLEGDREAMTEDRFVELTTELLQADRRYHYAMQDVMEAVIEASWESEGATAEGDRGESDDDDDEKEGRERVRT